MPWDAVSNVEYAMHGERTDGVRLTVDGGGRSRRRRELVLGGHDTVVPDRMLLDLINHHRHHPHDRHLLARSYTEREA